jgi:hypothetical protein
MPIQGFLIAARRWARQGPSGSDSRNVGQRALDKSEKNLKGEADPGANAFDLSHQRNQVIRSNTRSRVVGGPVNIGHLHTSAAECEHHRVKQIIAGHGEGGSLREQR